MNGLKCEAKELGFYTVDSEKPLEVCIGQKN